MKRILICALMALVMIFACAASAENSWAQTEQEPAWYELSWEGDVLTVRLPGNTKSGLSWSHEISNPDALELITMETIVGEEEGMAGAPTTYVASFLAKGNRESTAALICRCAANEYDAAEYTRVLQLNISKDNKIAISSVQEIDPFADWCEYGDDQYILVVRMPSADWSFEILDPDMIELITCDNSTGQFVASFMATLENIGVTEIVFTSDDGLSNRAVNVFINESGMLFVERVDKLEIMYMPNLVYCEKCYGWFEEGSAFDSHLCVEPEVTKVPVDFKTVAVTGGSVHMRAGAGTHAESLMLLKKGENAKYLGETQTDANGMKWHKITFAGKTGWISGKYSTIGGKGYIKVVGGNCNMRKQPNLEGAIITTIKKDTVITYLGEGSTDTRGVDWYKVSYNGKEGWMTSQYTAFTVKPTTSTTNTSSQKYVTFSGDSHLREKANVDAVSLMVIKKGSTANYLGETAKDERGVEWYKVSFSGRTGWVSSKYASLTNTKGSSSSSSSSTQTPDDMRLVLNPNRYDVLRVTDIFSQDGRTYYIDGCFGTINKYGEPEKFDARKSVRLVLNPGAEVLLPVNPDDPSSIGYVDDAAIWFANQVNTYGSGFQFYATFSMNEGGAIRNLVYKFVD